MCTYQITLLPENRLIRAGAGENLLAVLQKAGCAITAPCGGNGTCGKCRVLINGEENAACHVTVDRDMAVTLPQQRSIRILNTGTDFPVKCDGTHEFVLAFDVGTTTVACCLLDGKSGQLLSRCGAGNPQARYGSDIVSRLRYALQNSSRELETAIRQTLFQLTREAARIAQLDPRRITLAAIAGNTAMHHLLLGIDPAPLTRPPYMPGVREAMELPAGDMLPIHPQARLRILPNIAGFIGGDTVGCMSAVGLDRQEELTLLIDVGTNAEMVLGTKSRRITCSAAAGPAFEGVGISRGMTASAGAIDRVTAENGQLRHHTIGEGTALGLCGSGLLDLVAALLDLGEISGSGLLSKQSHLIPGTDVALTRKDVRQVQLAKSAIRSGIELMAKAYGAAAEDIRRVYLAGAFGNYLDPVSACRIGMIPPILLDRIHPIGNAALDGVCRCALSLEEFDRAKKLAAETEFLELASLPEFQDCFVDNLLFEGEEE